MSESLNVTETEPASPRERMSMSEPDWPEWLFHVQRYAYACRFVSGCRVLDCACGEGYGTELMAHYARECVGVDISEEAISTANVTYGSCPTSASSRVRSRRFHFRTTVS